VDPEYGERVNQSIRDYTKFFPNKEDAFFYDIKEGTTVTVGCWVNETTKARF
jgi:hypothetical protein